MITWLASYPRSGNTFLRILLHRLYGLPTHSRYSVADASRSLPADTGALMRLSGQSEVECDIGQLRADSGTHYVKTHELPDGDGAPALVVIRDGRDAMVSYAHFVLKTMQGIDRPSGDLFEETLQQLIVGENFGGWSANVNAWIDRVGWGAAIRYEDLIRDPFTVVSAACRRLGIGGRVAGAAHPSFQELHAAVPWFFRKGRSGCWTEEMPRRLRDLFLERHGDTLLRLGYPEAPSRGTMHLANPTAGLVPVYRAS